MGGGHNGGNGAYYDPINAVSIAAAAAAAANRQKRMRTSFKHHQLRVMKSYFEVNHNPDAKDLKNLSVRTGLSKRVLQVWFQNARAKYRRGQSTTGGVDDVAAAAAAVAAGQPTSVPPNGPGGSQLSDLGEDSSSGVGYFFTPSSGANQAPRQPSPQPPPPPPTYHHFQTSFASAAASNILNQTEYVSSVDTLLL